MATPNPAPPDSLPHGDWHLHDAHELARLHGVNPAHGLQADQVSQRTIQHGANELPASGNRTYWSLLVEQFSDFMILVLIAAAVISGVVGDLVDTLVILIIVVLNAAIGLVQAWRADQALAALKRLSADHGEIKSMHTVESMRRRGAGRTMLRHIIATARSCRAMCSASTTPRAVSHRATTL